MTVKGSPSVEEFISSYNAISDHTDIVVEEVTGGDTTLNPVPDNDGYMIKWYGNSNLAYYITSIPIDTDDMYVIADTSNDASACWIGNFSAANKCLMIVGYIGSMGGRGCGSDGVGVRPLITLPASATLTWSELDNAYIIE